MIFDWGQDWEEGPGGTKDVMIKFIATCWILTLSRTIRSTTTLCATHKGKGEKLNGEPSCCNRSLHMASTLFQFHPLFWDTLSTLFGTFFLIFIQVGGGFEWLCTVVTIYALAQKTVFAIFVSLLGCMCYRPSVHSFMSKELNTKLFYNNLMKTRPSSKWNMNVNYFYCLLHW